VKMTSVVLGGSGGDRTRDILLKRLSSTPYQDVPTSVHAQLHTLLTLYLLGRVAVKSGGQIGMLEAA
jgi:hypothetical protein